MVLAAVKGLVLMAPLEPWGVICSNLGFGGRDDLLGRLIYFSKSSNFELVCFPFQNLVTENPSGHITNEYNTKPRLIEILNSFTVFTDQSVCPY